MLACSDKDAGNTTKADSALEALADSSISMPNTEGATSTLSFAAASSGVAPRKIARANADSEASTVSANDTS
jgi:hypothetical protein